VRGTSERGVFGETLLTFSESANGAVERTYEAKVAQRFLREFWQRRPVLFRNALPSFSSPLSPDELAGLACEQDVESRVVINWSKLTSRPEYRAAKKPSYELRLGPFSEADFDELPEQGYTLLVQEVNAHIQEVSDLLDHFRFIPNWRLDDVMVSYATEGGGVGPHVDSYDVFLLQAEGRRRWSISYTPIGPEEEDLEPDLDVRVLRGGFHIDEEWILEPGDMLYVPPRVPHWGTSMDDSCMTFSIGMRAPDKRELVRSLTDYFIERRVPARTAFLEDEPEDLCESTVGSTSATGNGDADPGLISDQSVAIARSAVQFILDLDEKEFARWYARFVTLPKRMYDTSIEPEASSQVPEAEATGIVAEIASGAGVSLRHREAAVFSYLKASSAGTDGDQLYVNGESFQLGPESRGSAKLLCTQKVLTGSSLQKQLAVDPGLGKLLTRLIALGFLYCVYDDDL